MKATADQLHTRDVWAETAWSSADLKGPALLVALAYADHAGRTLNSVFVDGARLRARTGLSRDAANRALRQLEAAGWLVVVQRGRQHHSTRYALRPPQGSASRNADEPGVTGDGTLSALSDPSHDASVPSSDISVPRDGTDLPTDLPNNLPQFEGPVVGLAARHDVGAAARAVGDVPAQHLEAVIDLALADSRTRAPAARMAKDPAWRANLVDRADRITRDARERFRQRVQDCPGCYGSSWREDPGAPGVIVGKCDHRELDVAS